LAQNDWYLVELAMVHMYIYIHILSIEGELKRVPKTRDLLLQDVVDMLVMIFNSQFSGVQLISLSLGVAIKIHMHILHYFPADRIKDDTSQNEPW